MVLNDRCIAEMRTGEGAPADRNAASLLPKPRCPAKVFRVVTVNDYLAQRVTPKTTVRYSNSSVCPLGINSLCMPAPAKREALRCRHHYGTNNEYGFRLPAL